MAKFHPIHLKFGFPTHQFQPKWWAKQVWRRYLKKCGYNGHLKAQNRPTATLARALPMSISWPFNIQSWQTHTLKWSARRDESNAIKIKALSHSGKNSFLGPIFDPRPLIGNVGPMDSKPPSKCRYLSWPTHISKSSFPRWEGWTPLNCPECCWIIYYTPVSTHLKGS